MNAVEKRVRKIAVTLTNASTYNDITDVMHTVAYCIGGYSTEMNAYFSGLFDFIDTNDKAFKPLTEEQKSQVQNIGARLLLNREHIVIAFVRLHHMLKWADGEELMMKLTDNLYIFAEKEGYPAVKYDD